jgi:hypothetical protein
MMNSYPIGYTPLARKVQQLHCSMAKAPPPRPQAFRDSLDRSTLLDDREVQHTQNSGQVSCGFRRCVHDPMSKESV